MSFIGVVHTTRLNFISANRGLWNRGSETGRGRRLGGLGEERVEGGQVGRGQKEGGFCDGSGQTSETARSLLAA